MDVAAVGVWWIMHEHGEALHYALNFNKTMSF